ncbi:MAG: carbohydrate ABC transporter permease [Promethearchaeota archaeon]
MSLYENPTPLELRLAWDYYSDFTNISMSSLWRFFVEDSNEGFTKGIFIVEGLYIVFGFLVLFFYIRSVFLKLTKKTDFSRPKIAWIAILTGIISTPLIMLFLKWFFQSVTVVSVLVRLPIEEYRIVLTDFELDFVRVLFNTVFWTVTCTFLHVVLGMFLAILLNRDFTGKGFFRGIFILPWAIPSFVSTLVWRAFIFDNKQGILGRYVSNLPTNTSYSLTVAQILSIAVAGLVMILIIMRISKLISKKWNIHASYKPILNFCLFLIAVPIGYLLFQATEFLFNVVSIQALSTPVVDIPEITSTFWYTDDVYLFGIHFKMLTFSAILVNVWLGVPFMMISMLAALQSIPKDLYEAAEIDGASQWQQFKSITFPLLKPTLFTISLLGVIWTFNLFNVVYLLSQNQTGLRSIDYNIFVTFIYERFTFNEYSRAAALSFVVFLMLVSFSAVYKKVFDIEKMFIGVEEETKKEKKTKKKLLKIGNKKKKKASKNELETEEK